MFASRVRQQTRSRPGYVNKHVRVLGMSTKMFASRVRQQFGDSYHPVLLSSGKVPVGVYEENWLCFEERASKSDTVGCYRFALAVGNGRSVSEMAEAAWRYFHDKYG